MVNVRNVDKTTKGDNKREPPSGSSLLWSHIQLLDYSKRAACSSKSFSVYRSFQDAVISSSS